MGEIPEVSGNETMIETKARRDVERVVARFSRPLDYWLLWLLVLGSLGLNLYLLQTLLDLRDRAGQATGLVSEVTSEASTVIGELKTATITHTIEVDESIPLNLTVPIDEVLEVPIQTTVPINTTVSIPLRTPIGTFPINVPIVTTIPINITAEVPIHLSVPVSGSVPINFDVPIEIKLADTPLGASLDRIEQFLIRLEQESEK